jgi:hypothetical protein
LKNVTVPVVRVVAPAFGVAVHFIVPIAPEAALVVKVVVVAVPVVTVTVSAFDVAAAKLESPE